MPTTCNGKLETNTFFTIITPPRSIGFLPLPSLKVNHTTAWGKVLVKCSVVLDPLKL